MVVRFEVDACIAAKTATAGEGVKHPEPGDAGLEIETNKDIESPARQSFAAKDEGGESEVEPKKQEIEEVDFDKEDELWAGGGDNSWGPLPEPRRASKSVRVDSKGKEDMAPPPQDLSWDFPEDDGAAWGVTTDMAQKEDFEVNGELTVVRSGTLLPQSSILELATRSIRFVDRTSNEDTFLQLFLTQTPTHLVAIHQNGNFEKVVRQELGSAEFTRIAEMEEIQKSIGKFVEILKVIQRLVKEHGTSGRLSLVCEKGKLGLFGLGEEGRLSDVELKRFKKSV